MAKLGYIEVEGEVKEALPNTFFRVEIAAGSIEGIEEPRMILCHLSGKMRINYVRIMPGDRVRIELSAYDLTKGRIVFRQR